MTTVRREIAEGLSHRAAVTLQDADQLVQSVFEIIKARLARGDTVKICGFGSFVVHRKRARNVRDFQTGQPLTIRERRVVRFRISGVLKQRIERPLRHTKVRAQ